MPNLCIVPARVLCLEEVSEIDLRVLLAISRHADRYGENVWASAVTLSKVAGVSRRSFFRSAARLEALRLVRRTRRWKDNGEPDTSMYAVLLDEPEGGSVQAQTLPSDQAVAPGSAQAVAGRSAQALAHKRPPERPPEQKASSPARETPVVENLVYEHHRVAYRAVCTVPGARASVDYELRLRAEGGERPGFGAVAAEGWPRVGEALHQLVCGGRAFSSRSLGTFLDGLDPLPAAVAARTEAPRLPLLDDAHDPLTAVGL